MGHLTFLAGIYLGLTVPGFSTVCALALIYMFIIQPLRDL